MALETVVLLAVFLVIQVIIAVFFYTIYIFVNSIFGIFNNPLLG